MGGHRQLFEQMPINDKEWYLDLIEETMDRLEKEINKPFTDFKWLDDYKNKSEA